MKDWVVWAVAVAVCAFIIGIKMFVKEPERPQYLTSEAFLADWVNKNRLIHRLERRICRLRRANRALRAAAKEPKP